MTPSGRLRAKLLWLAVAMAAGGFCGIIYGYAVTVSGAAEGAVPSNMLRGMLSGLAIAAACAGADIFLLSNSEMRGVRALPFALFTALRAALYGVGIFTGLRLPVLLLDGRAAVHDWSFSNPLFTQSFAISMGISSAVALTIEISRLLGPGVLPALLSGRYHRPRREERIFLMADIEGSTALAERIGDLEFHRMLSAIYADWAAPVSAMRGRTYRYVGDEIIVSWPMERGVKGARCLLCVFEMRAALRARAGWYAREFGAAPRFRAALHCGSVVTGEMGDQRKEIVFLGDTMNTVARLQQECRVRGEEVLLSGRLADRLPPHPRIGLRALGDWTPRGKTRAIRVVAADQEPSQPAARIA